MNRAMEENDGVIWAFCEELVGKIRSFDRTNAISQTLPHLGDGSEARSRINNSA